MADLHSKPSLDPESTLILVTGASGNIASHVISLALKLGYHVRGTARSQAKAVATTKLHNSDRYSTVIVEDFAKSKDQVAAAFKGVDSVIHLATSTDFLDDPDVVIPPAIDGMNAVLEAAANEPSVKRFTLTSSSAALFFRMPGEYETINDKTWNNLAVKNAWNKRGEAIGPNWYPFVVYAASKVEQERAMWKFMETRKPHFVANTVLPDFNTGRILDEGSKGPTASMVRGLYENGQKIGILNWFVNVVDNAKIHVIAAVLDGDLKDKRIIAAAGPWNTNAMIDIIKKHEPSWNKAEKDPSEPMDYSKIDNRLGDELLKKWFGHGYVSLEQSLIENLPELE